MPVSAAQPPPTQAANARPEEVWIDATAGVAGDMLLGALIDAGAGLPVVQAAVDAVIPGTVRLSQATVRRAGLRATKVAVEPLAEDHPHRTWRTIKDLIAEAGLPAPVRDRALAVFGRLAGAEARVHGVQVDEVHFHEVGAWDSIADVVGVCAALHDLGVGRLTASPVALGSGRVRAAHGDIPVPVPAVLELSAGWQVLSGGEGELATPTGMALVTALAERCGTLPAMNVQRTGMGAGTKDTPGRANVVRIVLGTPLPAAPDSSREATDVVLEANIDDLDPRLWPGVLTALLADGASDAWLVPILMKKGRPAHTLRVLAPSAQVAVVRERMFRETSTIGVREWAVHKTALERTWVPVAVLGEGTVPVKVAHRGGIIVQATPEFEDVAALASAHGLPVISVLDAADAAAAAQGLVPGAALPSDTA
ncbi:nickel pincer cofactor biosynthesis protein LarC [Streptomyces cavernicola]|uniref:Pyridinium-3,5-bisthiocarboxylic acid mononucleotide nickel insertion protein n=1 Tax=Streptomyces cavernicola TaxID=3043613 RepID=A0ABT6S5M6_9ACTN|nr:nickel pincer cofactor biosynthesis protein LarC [Streptomyces sp. B-S-A6]MDI3403398.1 nickel pincer cofactor biosynthesis protein LarC [Streptomyces sp. B-S-A6]